jgi:hypothetical protein
MPVSVPWNMSWVIIAATHVHRTFHFVGPEAELDRIARATVKVGLDELTNTFRTSTTAR